MPKIPSERTWGLPKGSDLFVEAFARGLAVIRSFDARAPQQTLTEVAQRTGLTRAGMVSPEWEGPVKLLVEVFEAVVGQIHER